MWTMDDFLLKMSKGFLRTEALKVWSLVKLSDKFSSILDDFSSYQITSQWVNELWVNESPFLELMARTVGERWWHWQWLHQTTACYRTLPLFAALNCTVVQCGCTRLQSSTHCHCTLYSIHLYSSLPFRLCPLLAVAVMFGNMSWSLSCHVCHVIITILEHGWQMEKK